MSEAPDTGTETPQSAASRLFDLRSMIGGLFVLYGIMLTVAGFFTSSKELAKASHININLWLGIGMLVVGGFFAGTHSILGVTGWRWIFYINVPVALLALVVVNKVFNISHHRHNHRIDWTGAAALVAFSTTRSG